MHTGTHSFIHQGALTDLIRTTRHTTAHTKTFLGKNLHYHQRVDELRSASLVLVKIKQTTCIPVEPGKHALEERRAHNTTTLAPYGAKRPVPEYAPPDCLPTGD